MVEKGTVNKGLASYKDKQRQDRLAQIDEAILILREAGVKITLASLAEEMGVHVQTMYKPFIREYLQNFPEFNHNLEPVSIDPGLELESLKKQFIQLTEKQKGLQKKNVEQKNEIEKLKGRYKELEDKYRHLLGAYQQEVAAKHIAF